MRNDLTDITLVVDRSGSMDSCKEEAQNGINHFIEDQKKHDGQAVFSLVQFDTKYEFVHSGVPIDRVGTYTLTPRGMTALLDAVGRAINETGERLEKMAEHDRPGLVVFAIITDGHENSSHEFTKPRIKEMIQMQSEKYNWQFTFLGANQDAFGEAASIGITRDAAANVATKKFTAGYAAVSNNISRMRTAKSQGLTVSNTYTDAEREEMSK